MKKGLIRAILIAAALAQARGAPPSTQPGPTAEAEILIGSDSYERRFLAPSLRFEFPAAGFRAFMAMSYTQSSNSRLKGPVDFWLRTGLLQRLSPTWSLEASLNHMCRHMTSVFNPDILDVNEVLGRLWAETGRAVFSLGAGGYIGKTADYRSLIIGSAGLRKILGTEFSISAEVKLVNGDNIYHDVEVSAALDEGTDLFVKNMRPYGARSITYLGLRLKSQGAEGSYVDRLKLRLGWYPDYVNHKVIGDLDFQMKFYEGPGRRVLLALRPSIPVLRTEHFFGRFQPARVIYPLSAEYEREVGKSLFAAFSIRYHLNMPVDVSLRPTSSLSAGIFLRNQRDFERLDRAVRFEVFAGRNFQHDYDAGLSLGANSGRGRFKWGGDLRLAVQPAEFRTQAGIFANFDSSVNIRPFAAVEVVGYRDGPEKARGRLLLGLSLFRWF